MPTINPLSVKSRSYTKPHWNALTRDQEMKSRIGKLAVEFELKDTNGSIHRLEDDAGHWLLLVFHRHLG